MPSINDRIGSQNVIRVLSNASAPPTRLANLNDINSARKDEDGLVLVWDSLTQQFVLTDKIDASSLIQTGISSISNTTDSISAITGALTVAGGVGISKNLTLGAGFVAAGVATITSNIDANASVDIFRDLKVNNNLSVTGLTTLTGITTTVGDLYVGGDLYLKDDLVLDNVSGSSLKITGISTLGVTTATDLEAQNLIISGFSTFTGIVTTSNDLYVGGSLYLKDNLNLDNIGGNTLSIGGTSTLGVTTATDLEAQTLNVTGFSTFTGIATVTGAIDANGGLNVSGGTGFIASSAKISDLTSGRVVYAGASGELQDSANLTFDGTELSAGLIDGGSF